MAQVARRAEEERRDFSGRLLLRMPPALHAEVSRKAELEQVSLNQFITTAVAAQPDGATKMSVRTPPRISRSTLGIALAVNLVVVGIAGIGWRSS